LYPTAQFAYSALVPVVLHGMSTLARKLEPLAVDVNVSKTTLHVVLADGREVSAPLEWFPRLLDASPKQRRVWRLIGGGVGIHWPEVDEDISVQGLLEGRRAR
jgi:hypothetical protein